MTAIKRLASASARYKIDYLIRRYGLSAKRARSMIDRYGHDLAKLERAARRADATIDRLAMISI